MRMEILALALVGLAGCIVPTPRVQSVSLPDGRQGYAVRCNGNRQGWADCMNKAGEVCKQGAYDVYTQDASTGQFSQVTGGPGGLQGYNLPVRHREMIFACRTP